MGSTSGKLTKKEIRKICEETKYTKKEVKQWYRGFMKDCPSGKLSREDFTAIYSEFFPSGNVTAFATFMFNLFDEDQSGEIDFSEFLLALSVTSRGQNEDKLEWVFKLYDIDGSGSVDRGEMSRIISAIVSMNGPIDDKEVENRVDKLFTLMDKDGDGEVTKEEFFEGAQKDAEFIKMLSAPTVA